MQVTVDAALTAIYKCQLLTFQQGDVVRGDIAAYLLRSGAAVTPADDDAAALAESKPDEQAATRSALADAGIPFDEAVDVVAVDDAADDGEQSDEAVGEFDISASTIDQVLAWVGDNSERALAAHAAEEARGDKARSTLLSKLAEIGLD